MMGICLPEAEESVAVSERGAERPSGSSSPPILRGTRRALNDFFIVDGFVKHETGYSL